MIRLPDRVPDADRWDWVAPSEPPDAELVAEVLAGLRAIGLPDKPRCTVDGDGRAPWACM